MISRRVRQGSIALAVGVISAVALAGSAFAADEIKEFTAVPSTTQAGGHPNITINMEFTTRTSFEYADAAKDARRVWTHMPTGVVGNPHAIPTCSLVAFGLGECPPASQVGVAGANPLGGAFIAPLYNMEPKPGQAGLLAFTLQIAGTQQFLEVSGRTDSDYGLDSISTPIFHPLLGVISRIYTQLWGVPADPANDALRFDPPVASDCILGNPCEAVGTSAGVAPEPFLSNPTTCGVPLTSGLEIEFYNGNVVSSSASYPATTGCDQLAFNPSLTVKPTTEEGDSASGLDATLKVPQLQNPFTPSPSQIRGVRVILPEGFSLNPNAADGKSACLDSQTAIGTLLAATCPQFSKVGTLVIDSSALPGPVPGAIYLGEPKAGDPYRLILAADGFGTHIKLEGSAKTNPETGQITVAFEDLPQSPLTEFDMHFFGSERGLLATPTRCGKYPVRAQFEPWNSVLPDQESTSFFSVTAGPQGNPCPGGARPLSPELSAGTTNPTAGRHTPFKLEVARRDGEQNLAGLTVSTPVGFSGVLRGIPYCSEQALTKLTTGGVSGVVELAEPSCPAESQIGTAATGVGAGNHPLYTPGRVYLAGPYKSAPLSLMVVVPAVSGPYDLGVVAVRAAIGVDPVTARVSTVSDPLPQILEGIPLRTRTIRVELDRPNFALNPTNCHPLSTDARVSGSEGAVALVGSHFQVANCSDLPFEPRLALRFKGGTGRTGHPAVIANLIGASGEANLARAIVTLPTSQIIDNANIQSPCTRVQFAAGACPPESIIGQARAETPLLDAPLIGPVYLRSSSNKLPDLVADLDGQIDFEVAARVDSVKRGIRTSFLSVPDVPVSGFVLSLNGGKNGLLQNSRNLCRGRQVAAVSLRGQNGRRVKRRTQIKTSCRSGSKPRRRATRLFHARKAG